jgi:predicted nuclease with TOPRIM domain|tara:strand:- start:658 stop:984 length:327 start_codon:yes stop_codon:yes gene_type:complete
MEQEVLMSILTAITSALGVKEIWLIYKKRVELNQKKLNKDANLKDKLMSEVILDLKHKIEELETKIDELIEENTMLREKLARMEERLMLSATSKARTKRSKIEKKPEE